MMGAGKKSVTAEKNKAGETVMDIRKLSEEGNALKVMITGIDTAMLNGLRRSLMNAVPNAAAESITIYENGSIMPDEMLCHRIGLLPLRLNAKKTEKGETVSLSLEKEGPCTVYSSDIAGIGKDIEMSDAKVPLVSLAKEQRVKMDIQVKVGVGKEHAKWQPALVTYKQVPKVSFAKVKDPHALVKQVSNKELEIKAGKVFLTDPANSRLIGLLREKFSDEVTVDFDTDSFVLTIESYQGNNGKELLLKAVESLEEKNKEFQDAAKSL